jgi:tRNA A37 threonylcarbamoyladenosine modification protein TsaB
MGEVYSAVGERRGDVVVIVGEERLSSPADVKHPTSAGWCAVGSGLAAHAEELQHVTRGAGRLIPSLVPSALDLFPQAARDLAAGRTTSAAAALPVYLREHTAWRRSS